MTVETANCVNTFILVAAQAAACVGAYPVPLLTSAE
jgi:hypothetical protein